MNVNKLRPYSKEIGIGFLVVLCLYAYWSFWIADMQDQIDALNQPSGVPGRQALMKKLKDMLGDARQISGKLDAIKRSPMAGASLAATLEHFNQQHALTRERARLSPRPVQTLEGRLQEELVEVLVDGLTNSELIRYLSDIETLGTAVRIRSLRIQRVGDLASISLNVAAIKVM